MIVTVTLNPTPSQGARLMIICAILDGSAGMFIKLLPWNPFVIAGLRSLTAALLLFIYYRGVGIRIAVNKNTLLAGFMISAMFISFVSATRLTTAANAISLQYCNPVFIILFLFLLYKQRPKRGDMLTIFGALLGIALIFGGSITPGSMPGNLLALFSGVCLAGMYIYNNRVKESADHFSALVMGHAVTFLIGIYFICAYPPLLSVQSVSAVLALGIFQQAVQNILYSYAIRVCRPLTCSLIMMMQLLLNPLLVYLAVGETPTAMQALGCAVIFAVSVITLLRKPDFT